MEKVELVLEGLEVWLCYVSSDRDLGVSLAEESWQSARGFRMGMGFTIGLAGNGVVKMCSR